MVEVILGSNKLGDIGRVSKSSLLITSPHCWQQVAEYFPETVGSIPLLHVDKVEEKTLSRAYSRLSPPKKIIAVGCGSVTDFSKILAKRWGSELVGVPTSLSTNCFMTSKSALRRNKTTIETIDTKLPDRVILDTALLSKCPPRFNRAGLGDVLSIYTADYDWKLADKAGVEKYVPGIGGRAVKVLNKLLKTPKDYSQNTPKTLSREAKILIEMSNIVEDYGSGRPESGSEHILGRAVDNTIFPRKALHGEVIALDVLICSYLQDNYSPRILEFLKKAKITFEPDKVGVHEKELKRAVSIAHTIRPERYSVFNEKRGTPELIDEVFEVIGYESDY